MINNLSRLAFLANEFRPDLPPKKVLKYCPTNDILQAIAGRGLSGASVELDISPDQLMNVVQEGKRGGPGSDAEFRLLLAQTISAEIDLRRDEFVLTDYFRMVSMLDTYVTGDTDQLVENDEAVLDHVPQLTPLEKWYTGFEPWDLITGGFYQGITMVMGRPGHGKTTLMLAVMEAMRANNVASSVWFFELEIPLDLMLYRNSPSRERTKFLGDDRIICGLSNIDAVIERVKENPDPNRVVFLDSPDVMAGGIGEGRRYALEDIYRDLIRLKQHCKHVFVASQARRRDHNLSQESVAEAWAKAFYVDIIITMNRMGRGVGQWSRVRSNVGKNRFGPPDREINFSFNYADLSWEVDSASRENVGTGDGDDDW